MVGDVCVVKDVCVSERVRVVDIELIVSLV